MRNKVLIVAELSANHNQDFDLAMHTIKAMADSGADAVKFQTFRPTSFTINADTEYFAPRKEGLWKGMRPIDLYTQGSMPYDWQPKLKRYANELGLICFSTPFDKEGVDFMEEMDMPMYKIASLEINETNLIRYVASKHKPIIISTGAASEEDIRLAISICKEEGNNDITLLKCTSEYPAPIEKANIRTMVDMATRFNVEVGVSDHSMSNIIPIMAVTMGAVMIEKHFILERSLGGIDSAFSLEPTEFASMVSEVRMAEQALGVVDYSLLEKDMLRRRSLFVAEDMKTGDVITEQNIRSVRPGYGLAPKHLPNILGKQVNRDLKKGEIMSLEFLMSN